MHSEVLVWLLVTAVSLSGSIVKPNHLVTFVLT